MNSSDQTYYFRGGKVRRSATLHGHNIKGRPATIFHIVCSLEALLEKHPNDTDEDVVPAINELLKRIVVIEETNNSTLKRELDDFKALGVFERAKWLLEKSEVSKK